VGQNDADSRTPQPLSIAIWREIGAGDDRDIEASPHDLGDTLPHRACNEVESDIGMGFSKILHQFGQEYGHRTGKNPDPDYPFRATPRCRRIANCRLDLDESCACPVNKATAGDRQPDAVRLSLEQRNAKSILQRFDAAADCRLIAAQRSRDAADAREIGDQKRLREGDKVDALEPLRRALAGGKLWPSMSLSHHNVGSENVAEPASIFIG
ncbi:MAG: hypothetical protein WA156_14845, partial [Methylocystis silviterrae]